MLGICKGVYIHSHPTASPVDPTCVCIPVFKVLPTLPLLHVFRLLLHYSSNITYIYICICVICLYVCTQMPKSWAPYFDVIDTYYYYYYIIYFDVIDTYYHYLILKHTLSYIIVFTHARVPLYVIDIISYFIILLFYLQH